MLFETSIETFVFRSGSNFCSDNEGRDVETS